ncbi:MAG: hypothetical protein BGO98_23355 [Myxococcales bacterium 68-20]|nr:MAG: hypothetical protein BGO98_23355 [Myxococcales bacterium 68-20]
MPRFRKGNALSGCVAAAVLLAVGCSDSKSSTGRSNGQLTTPDAAKYDPNEATDAGATGESEPDPRNAALVEDTCVIEFVDGEWTHECPGATRGCVDLSGLGIHGSKCFGGSSPCPVCFKSPDGFEQLVCPPGETIAVNFSSPPQYYCAPKS